MLDPRSYFKYTGCSSCLDKPCNRLRYGGGFPGKFILVQYASLSATLIDCPFVARDANEIEWLLGQIAPEELFDHVNEVLERCDSDELLQIQERFSANGPLNGQSIALVIRDLWESNIMGVIRIPRLFYKNPEIRKWLFAFGQNDKT
jgi:hypothetical protein